MPLVYKEDTSDHSRLLEDGTAGSPTSERRASPTPTPRRWLLPALGSALLLLFLYGQATKASSAPPRPVPIEPFDVVLAKAGRRALGGGLSGAFAGVLQVLLLMWLRTTMNYQYRYGGTTRETLRLLWREGGVRRFYQGLPWALLQTPLTRFGDTASNSGVLLLLGGTAFGQALPLGVRTAIASTTAATWRIVLTPVDTMKTTMQVGTHARTHARAHPRVPQRQPCTLERPAAPSDRHATRPSHATPPVCGRGAFGIRDTTRRCRAPLGTSCSAPRRARRARRSSGRAPPPTSPPTSSATTRGTSRSKRRLGGAMAGCHQLARLHLKAWGCPRHS